MEKEKNLTWLKGPRPTLEPGCSTVEKVHRYAMHELCLLISALTSCLICYRFASLQYFSQLQVQRTSSIRPSKISKIFLTHAHGDHSFGLPGLLCMMGQDTSGGNESAKGPNGENIKKTRDSKKSIDIYGPEGLRLWLRTAIRYSVSRIVPHYRVHELKDVAMAPEWGYSAKWEKYYFD